MHSVLGQLRLPYRQVLQRRRVGPLHHELAMQQQSDLPERHVPGEVHGNVLWQRPGLSVIGILRRLQVGRQLSLGPGMQSRVVIVKLALRRLYAGLGLHNEREHLLRWFLYCRLYVVVLQRRKSLHVGAMPGLHVLNPVLQRAGMQEWCLQRVFIDQRLLVWSGL